jgi:hypothetical protein
MRKSLILVLLVLLCQPVLASPANRATELHPAPVERIGMAKPKKFTPKVEIALPVLKTPVREKPSPASVGSNDSSSNEKAAWSFLIARYSRNQTAGIMGNLRQEHNFQTSGDGLAQWIGGRRARLHTMANPYSLNTQLNFLVIEMKEMGLVLPNTVEGATIAFQNKFERCGRCMQSQRVQYAYDILARH